MKKELVAILFCSAMCMHAEILKNDIFAKNAHGWNTPNYWNGKLVHKNGSITLESTEKNGRVLARALGYSKQIEFFPGYKIRLTVRAKGEGKLLGGLLFYQVISGAPIYLPGKALELGAAFKDYVYEIELQAVPRMILPYLEIPDKGKAVIQSVRMETTAEKDASIQTRTSLQIIKASGTLQPVVFQTNFKNVPVRFIQQSGNKITEQSGTVAADGSIRFQPVKSELGDIHLTAAAKGVSATAFADVMTDMEFEKMDALAKKVKFGGKIHVLIIGDSLSDFFRGRNYADKLSFWLNRYNPGKFTFRNAGVGGDLLPRVEERLCGIEGKSKAYRQNMYDNLFAEKYDLIFLFLGQNDTYVTRSGNFDNPRTPSDQHALVLKKVLAFLRKHSNAEIVLISPSPSDEQLFLDRAKKIKGDMGIFGSTKHVNAFDETNRKVCSEQKLDYIDILNPMRKIQNRKSLYVEDGVHLSNDGARLIAHEILCWFASKNWR